jgi:transposase
MYIESVPNRNSPPAILLRESWREGKTTRKKTIANLGSLSLDQIESMRLILRGEKLVSPQKLFIIERSLPHGHVEAILGTIRNLGLDQIISSTPSRERDLVIGMIAERLIHGRSKLASVRLWQESTLAQEMGIEDASEDELYSAMEWLLGRQRRIERKLARRHLSEGDLVLYDLSSSYYEGEKCALVKYGYSRDGKKGLPIIVYGVMTDRAGRPLAIEVYPGNTSDSTTVVDQVEKVKDRFGLKKIVMVGDRGMLTAPQIEILKEHPGIGWITALRSSAIRDLIAAGNIPSLFDDRQLAQIVSSEYPGERLIACYNPFLAVKRKKTREQLLAATEKDLKKLEAEVQRRTKKQLKADQIGFKAGKIMGRYKMNKHFKLTIADANFLWERNADAIAEETKLDGIYVVRTSEIEESLSAEETVRSYKSLSHVERVFRGMKGPNIQVRPIHHRTDDHVKAHIFLCMLAYYLQWEMRRLLAPLIFDDEELECVRHTRNAVLPAQPSQSAQIKKNAKMTTDGFPLHSFDTLLEALKSRTRNTCRLSSSPADATFTLLTAPTKLQQKALELLDLCPQPLHPSSVPSNP